MPTSSFGLFTSPRKRNAIVCLLLALATLALYNPVTHHPFVNYDDDRYVTENPHIQQGLTTHTIVWALTSTEQANWHPLTWMSHALDYSLFHLNPAGHHFSSILLHAVNVVLLYLLLVWATGRLGPSLFVAALFALHPLNVESVAWVAERKNVLCTFFFFLTLGAYSWYVQKPNWKRYLAVFVLFAAGLASKPMVITLPFVLLLLDYWPLNRVDPSSVWGHLSPAVRGAEPRSPNSRTTFLWFWLAVEKLPLLALSAASSVITVVAQRAGGSIRTTAEFSLSARLANAVYAYTSYLWKMLWPARLAPLYPHPGDSLAMWRVWLAGFALLVITACVWRFRTRRYLLVGWLWFMGMLVPVIGLVQVGEAAMADRYAYIPLIGIFGMIAFGVADSAQHESFRPWLALPAAAVLAALAFATLHQIGCWKSNYDLWSHTLAVTTNNFVAEDNLGGALILEDKEEEARPHFEAAARINPRDPMSHSNLGTYFQNHGQMRQAIQQYQAAVDLTSDRGLLTLTYANLGAAQLALGEEDQAANSFEQSLRYNPNQFNAWMGLGLLAQRQGKMEEAITALSRSVTAQPTAQGYYELGNALALAGRATQALAAYQQALKVEPEFVQAQQALDALRQPKQ